MIILLLIMLNTFLLASGQLFMKLGVTKVGSVGFHNILSILFSPYILLGLTSSVAATLLWLYILSKGNLSFVYPLTSLSFIFTALLAKFVLHENISATGWIGIFVICFGVFLVSYR